MDPTVQRLQGHLKRIITKDPNAWKRLANFCKSKNEPGWPDWCYVPLSEVFKMTLVGIGDILPKSMSETVAGGLGTWRMTQGVYRFDPDLLEALLLSNFNR